MHFTEKKALLKRITELSELYEGERNRRRELSGLVNKLTVDNLKLQVENSILAEGIKEYIAGNYRKKFLAERLAYCVKRRIRFAQQGNQNGD